MIATLVIAGALICAAPPKITDLFQDSDYRYGEKQERTLRCHLFVPRDLNPSTHYPLLVWLYQAGDVGPGFLGFVLSDLEHVEKYQFFIIAIQCPPMDSGWFNSVGASEPYGADAALVAQIVRKTIQEHSVDVRQVCLAGASRGGSRCWAVAARYPELFAVVPMASGSGDVSHAEDLAGVPIWAFHNIGDTGIRPDDDVRTTAAVAAAGGYIHLTLFPTQGHDAWTAPFREYDILAWMFAQRRGAWICWVPPGTRPWKWRHILTEPFMVSVIVGLAWYLERARRLRKNRPAANTWDLDILQKDVLCVPMCPDETNGQRLVQRRVNPAITLGRR